MEPKYFFWPKSARRYFTGETNCAARLAKYIFVVLVRIKTGVESTFIECPLWDTVRSFRKEETKYFNGQKESNSLIPRHDHVTEEVPSNSCHAYAWSTPTLRCGLSKVGSPCWMLKLSKILFFYFS